MKLYHHQTDGGAEYLCTSAIEGTNEGDMRTAIVRLDGEPELLNPVYSAAPKLLEALKLLVHMLNKGVIEVYRWNEGARAVEQAEKVLKKASS
jgi:hypothetical protein